MWPKELFCVWWAWWNICHALLCMSSLWMGLQTWHLSLAVVRAQYQPLKNTHMHTKNTHTQHISTALQPHSKDISTLLYIVQSRTFFHNIALICSGLHWLKPSANRYCKVILNNTKSLTNDSISDRVTNHISRWVTGCFGELTYSCLLNSLKSFTLAICGNKITILIFFP